MTGRVQLHCKGFDSTTRNLKGDLVNCRRERACRGTGIRGSRRVLVKAFLRL